MIRDIRLGIQDRDIGLGISDKGYRIRDMGIGIWN